MSDITVTVRAELEHYEAIIQRGIETFYEVGTALLAIRDKRLYRETHGTFEEYCRDRWGMAASRARQLIAASEVVHQLESVTNVTLPQNEFQTRTLAQFDEDLRPAILRTASSRYGTLTESNIRRVGTVIQEMANTGHVDTGNGNSTPIDAALDVEDAEAAKRQKEYISKNKPKLNRAGDVYEPQGFDACQTPAYAIDPLLPYLDRNWIPWESACGDGLLVDALYDGGFITVEQSDLLTGLNFFEWQPDQWDCQITNPPYSIKYKWLERSYELRKPFALLLPVETLGAKSAQVLFREHGVRVLLLDRRVNFKMPNIGWDGSSAQFPVAWFTWGIPLESELVFGRMTPVDDVH